MTKDRLATYIKEIATETGAHSVFVLVLTAERGNFSCMAQDPKQLATLLRAMAARIETNGTTVVDDGKVAMIH